MTSKNLQGRLLRYALDLQEYLPFKMTYVPGKSLQNADAMSRIKFSCSTKHQNNDSEPASDVEVAAHVDHNTHPSISNILTPTSERAANLSYSSIMISAISRTGLVIDHVANLQREDPMLTSLIEYLENDVLPNDRSKAKKILTQSEFYTLSDENALYYFGDIAKRKLTEQSKRRLVIPAALQKK
jgi:hypothetical protein